MDLINRRVLRERFVIRGTKVVSIRQADSSYAVWLRTDAGAEYFAHKCSVRRDFDGNITSFETCGKYYTTPAQAEWEDAAVKC